MIPSSDGTRFLQIQVNQSLINGKSCDDSRQVGTTLDTMQKWFEMHAHICSLCIRSSGSANLEGLIQVGERKAFSVDSYSAHRTYRQCARQDKNDVL